MAIELRFVTPELDAVDEKLHAVVRNPKARGLPNQTERIAKVFFAMGLSELPPGALAKVEGVWRGIVGESGTALANCAAKRDEYQRMNWGSDLKAARSQVILGCKGMFAGLGFELAESPRCREFSAALLAGEIGSEWPPDEVEAVGRTILALVFRDSRDTTYVDIIRRQLRKIGRDGNSKFCWVGDAVGGGRFKASCA